MARKNLRKTAYKGLEFNLKDVEIFQGKVTGNNKSCSKIQVPLGWKGKKVLVVMIN